MSDKATEKLKALMDKKLNELLDEIDKLSLPEKLGRITFEGETTKGPDGYTVEIMIFKNKHAHHFGR